MWQCFGYGFAVKSVLMQLTLFCRKVCFVVILVHYVLSGDRFCCDLHTFYVEKNGTKRICPRKNVTNIAYEHNSVILHLMV